MGLLACLRPIYFRVVPGRLDVLHYSAFRHRPLRTLFHDLKSAPVLVDLRRSLIFIGEGRKIAEYSFLLVPAGARLAYQVLVAAISTYKPGPLPEDDMVG